MTVKGAKGILRVPLNKRQYYIVVGGPYQNKPMTMRGVKMAKEVGDRCDVDIPTQDYHTPDVKLLTAGLKQAVDLIVSGEPVYIGCMGGMGRTGLFMAVLVKAFGVTKPVEYVRANYYAHAVETPEQYKFVSRYRIPKAITRKIKLTRRSINRPLWKLGWLRNNLTDFSAVFTGMAADEKKAEEPLVLTGRAFGGL